MRQADKERKQKSSNTWRKSTSL